MAERLAGKHILVTGSAQGIGLAIAQACLAEGAKLFLVDRDSGLLNAAVASLSAPQGQVGHMSADIRDESAPRWRSEPMVDGMGPTQRWRPELKFALKVSPAFQTVARLQPLGAVFHQLSRHTMKA
ncbi:SDR family NAD(P)-dependent oxidoreductase [Labrys neptuniae]